MRWILMLLLGAALGWFARDLTFDKTQRRAGRTASRPQVEPDRDPAPRPEPRALPARETDTASDPANAAPKPGAEAKPAKDPLREMVQALAKQWKAMSSMFAKQRAWTEQLLALGFDAETAKRIETLIGEEAARQTEKAVEMMFDSEVELDPDAFYWFMGVGPELSIETERDLALFLNDEEIASVRTEIRTSHEKQLRDYADMTMGMMGIPDLSDDQKTRMRGVLAGKDFIREQFVGFAQLTRDRKRLLHVLANPKDMAKQMTAQMAPMRRRMQTILRPDQFTRYALFEKQMVQMGQMQIKMVGAMLPKSETKKPAGQ